MLPVKTQKLWLLLESKTAGFTFILLSILFQAASAVLVKYAAVSAPHASLGVLLLNSFYGASLVCLVLQALVWQQALRQFDLSFAYPLQCLTNFVILCLSYFLFGEVITIGNLLGLAVISAGIFWLFRGDNS